MAEPMSDEDKRRRESDEISIASDFSIIPETFAGHEDVSPPDHQMASGLSSSFRSDHFHPSTSAEMSFGKVLFMNVQPTYTADSDIAVSYVLTESLTAKSSDRVALYRVGFGSPQDYLTYQWAPSPSRDHTNNMLPMTVVFKESSLPKDAGEFFQFCYVTHEGQIVGVSTPFQLHPVGSLNASNVCGVDEGEDGMVVVCTKESVLHDKINKLSEENVRLTLDLNGTKTALDEKQREMDDKMQQLTMCQHHLQALETKMAKETSEKCELMGRVGQVVEEKGHLEDRVKTLERNLDGSTSQVEALNKQIEKLKAEKNSSVEECLQLRKLREQLEHALQKCQDDLTSAEDKIQTLQSDFDQSKLEREAAVKELEFWTSSAAADKTEKNSLALRFSTVNEELICKMEELEKSKRLVSSTEEALATAVVDMTTLKDKLKETEDKLNKAEEEKNIHEERQNVVNQDNEQLKNIIHQLKNRIEQLESVQETEDSGREAAEKIASDLSGRLQAARAEYQALALTNLRLVKKIKKLRQSGSSESENGKTSAAMSSSVTSQGSSWLRVEEEEEEGAAENEEMEELERSSATGAQVAASMIQSCTSAMTSCSNCSHSTQQLSDAVHRKMEDIVRELSMQIQSLKTELKAREREQGSMETVEVEGDLGSERGARVSISSERLVSNENEVREERQSLERQSSERQSSERQSSERQSSSGRQSEPDREEPESVGRQEEEEDSSVNQGAGQNTGGDPQVENGGEPKVVLYGNSFLPARRTAPVFLPERQASPNPVQDGGVSVRPSAPSPTPSMISQRGQNGGLPAIVSSAASGPNLVVPQAHLAVVMSGSTLPPPLMPETTPTARQAAVMSQFSYQQLGTSGMGHESDDDDFHSTSDHDDTPTLTNENGVRLLSCPMCDLAFQTGAIRLLEEHINSHLEYVCPVCSMAFQRNNSKKFEEHVHEHFKDEADDNDDPLDDPSGPWGRSFRAARLLEID